MGGFHDDRDSSDELESGHTFGDGATRQLSAIHAGGQQIVIVIRQRLAGMLDALDEGDFLEALNRLNEAQAHLIPLANAQKYLAIADGSRIVMAAELRVGMTLTDVGEVTDVNIETCPVPACRRHITVMVGEHELRFSGDQEVYVSDQ